MRIAWNPNLYAYLSTIPRDHPWDPSPDKKVNYYDFRAHPELIRHVLEDFKPLDQNKAIVIFYDMLEWLNGGESALETNDCLLRGPFKITGDRQEVRGHLTVFFRDLGLNADLQAGRWLLAEIMKRINAVESAHEWSMDCAFWMTRFRSEGARGDGLIGQIVHVRFAAAANDSQGALEALADCFKVLDKALRAASAVSVSE